MTELTSPSRPGINITTAPDSGVKVVQIQLPQPGPRGAQGIPGQASVLTIGTVATGAPGSNAGATISGVSPNQTLNLTIPQGATGAIGPANTLTIGTVNTVNGLAGGSATITGAAPNQVLNLVLPRGYGVNPGGLAGDVLVKNSGTDYDVTWSTPTSAGTASTVMLRDSAGRAQVVDPSANADIATKGYVDNTAGTASNTASALVRRSSANAFSVTTITGLSQTPTGNDYAAAKGYVDTQDAAYRRVGTNNIPTAAYTFASTDEGKVVYYSADTSAVAYTIPANATVALPVGAWIDVYQANTGAVTIQGAAGVNLRGPDGSSTVTLRALYSKVRITKSNTDTWQVAGDIQNVSTQATTNATASPTVNTIIKRDVSGRAQVVDPSAAQDIATKNYVDTHVPTIADASPTAKGIVQLVGDLGGTATAPTVTGGTHHTHTSSQISDAASAATASKVIVRDANGRAQVVDPSVAADIATKNYVDTHTVPNSLSIGTVTTGAAGSSAAATITGTAPSQTLNLTIPTGATGATGPTGATGNGVLFLNATDPIPAGTPANTVIYRPNTTKTGSFFWGSGTAFPTSTAKGAGDTFLRTDVGTNGTLYQYSGSASSGTSGWVVEDKIYCTSTTVPTAGLYAGVNRFDTDTKNQFVYDGTRWVGYQGISDTGWVNIVPNSPVAAAVNANNVAYRVLNGTVHITTNTAYTGGAYGAGFVLFTLPVGVRPASRSFWIAGSYYGGQNCPAQIDPNGSVSVYVASSNTPGGHLASGSFPLG